MKQLFELPEYDYAFAEFYHTVCELMHQKDPLLSKIRADYADHIPTVQNTMPSDRARTLKPKWGPMDLHVFRRRTILSSFHDASECHV